MKQKGGLDVESIFGNLEDIYEFNKYVSLHILILYYAVSPFRYDHQMLGEKITIAILVFFYQVAILYKLVIVSGGYIRKKWELVIHICLETCPVIPI